MHHPVQELFSIRDAHSIVNESGKNFLSIELSPGGFSYCILDTEKFRYTLLESFAFEPLKDMGQLSHRLEDFVKEKRILTNSFQRISLAFSSPQVTFVPAELFSYSHKKLFLHFNTYPDSNHDIQVDKLNNLLAYAIYPFPGELMQKINYLFPACRIRHVASCLIENILYMVRYGRLTPNLVLHVQRDHFEILIFENENLSFYNSFIYQGWDDLFYYLFFVLEQLGLQAEELDAMIFGEVSIESEFYKKIRLYVKSVTFGPRTDLYKFSDAFDDIPHHYYYNLLNINACG